MSVKSYTRLNILCHNIDRVWSNIAAIRRERNSLRTSCRTDKPIHEVILATLNIRLKRHIALFYTFGKLSPQQNDPQFSATCKCVSLIEKVYFSYHSLFATRHCIESKSAIVHLMACSLFGTKSLTWINVDLGWCTYDVSKPNIVEHGAHYAMYSGTAFWSVLNIFFQI